MLSNFQIYCKLGLLHIADLRAYDHIVFLVALCAAYTLRSWKKLLVLVTAFTVGHSLTLALAALHVISPPARWVELLIPVTIIVTAAYNLSTLERNLQAMKIKYLSALLFGLIHGMGFSSYFRSLLGQKSEIVAPLFAFNIGIEVGQLLIVAALMAITFVVVEIFKIRHRYWSIFLSVLAIVVAVGLIVPQLIEL